MTAKAHSQEKVRWSGFAVAVSERQGRVHDEVVAYAEPTGRTCTWCLEV